MAGYFDNLQAIANQEDDDNKRRQQDLQAHLDQAQQARDSANSSGSSNPVGDVLSGIGNAIGGVVKGGESIVSGLYDSIVGTATRVAQDIYNVGNTAVQQQAASNVIDVAKKANDQADSDLAAGKITQDQNAQIKAQSLAAVNVASQSASNADKTSNAIDPVKAAGDAAMTTLNVLTMGGLGAAKSLATQGVEKGVSAAGDVLAENATANAGKKTVQSVAQNIGKDALVGGGFGAAGTASKEGSNATPQDYASSIALGGLTGAAIPIGAEAAQKVADPAIQAVKARISEAMQNSPAEAGFIKVPGGAPESTPTPTEVSPTPVSDVAPTPTEANGPGPIDAPTPTHQTFNATDNTIHDRLNPERTNPAGAPESIPQTETSPTSPIVDAQGNQAFVNGKADPQVFGGSAQLINIAKDKYIAAVKEGDPAGIKVARDNLVGVPVDKNAIPARNDLVNRIDSFAMADATKSPETVVPTSDTSSAPPAGNDTAIPANGPVPPTQDAGGGGATADSNITSKEQADSRFFNREQQLKDTKAGGSFLEKANQALFDRNAPLKAFDNENVAKTGQHLAAEDDPHALAQLVLGAPEAAQEGLRGVFNDMAYIKKNNLGDELMRYGTAKQVVSDRAGDYPESVVKEMQGTINRIEQEMPPEKLQQLEAARQNIVDYHNQTLYRLKDEGQLSPEQYQNIKNRNNDYFTGFNFAEHTNGNEKGFSTNSLNNAKAPIQSVKGVDDAGKFIIEDPTTAIPRQAVKLETQLAKHRVIDAVNRLQDKNPDSNLAVRLTTPESIDQKIDLNTQNAGLKPIRDDLVKTISSDAGTARKLAITINNLNKEGLNTSLKEGGARLDDNALKDVNTVGGDVATSQAGKLDKASVKGDEMTNLQSDVNRAITRRTGGDQKAQGTINEGIIEGAGTKAETIPSKLGPKDTAIFFKNLIEDNSRTKLDKIKAEIGNKDSKLSDLMDHIGNLRSQYDDITTQVRSNREAALEIAAKGKDVPEGYEAVETWQDGKRIRTAVLQPIADALKGKNDIQTGTIESILAAGSKPFRAAATVASPGFAPFAGIKDFGQLLLTSKNIPVAERALIVPAAIRYAKGLISAVTNDDLAKLVTKYGGGGANTLAESSEQLVKDSAKNFGGSPVESTQGMFKRAMEVISKPVNAYLHVAGTINHVIEYAPKLAEAAASLEKGNSPTQAAVDARNAVADMQNSGVIGRVLNNFVPFTNATLQGTANIGRYAKANPGTFTALAGATIALPALTAYAWNQTMYPKVWNDIDQSTKDNNFIIILSDNKDKAGNYTDVIKIPKNDAAKVIAAPIESTLSGMNKEYHDSIPTILLKTLGFLTPLNVERGGQFSGAALVDSTIGANPLVKVPVELATNTNTYTGNQITPDAQKGLLPADQVKKSTPGIDKAISAAVGGIVNPEQTGIIRQGLTASLGTTDPATSVTKRFAGATGGAGTQEFYQLAGQVANDRNRASNAIDKAIAAGDMNAAQDIVSRYNAQFRGTMDPWVQAHGADADQAMQAKFKSLQLNLSSSSVKSRLNAIAKTQAKAHGK